MINYMTIFFNKYQFFQRSRSLEKGGKNANNSRCKKADFWNYFW